LSVKILTAALVALILTGCSLPKIGLPKLYRINVQQGNVITQDMVDQLKPGMTRNQVAYIMGEPILRNTFNESRWDYVSTIVVPGYLDQESRISLFFEDDVLAYFTGDWVPSPSADEAADAAEEAAGTSDGGETPSSGDNTTEAG